MGRVQQCGRFCARGPRLAGMVTVLYLQDYRERSVIARAIPLAVPARAATGYAGSATF